MEELDIIKRDGRVFLAGYKARAKAQGDSTHRARSFINCQARCWEWSLLLWSSQEVEQTDNRTPTNKCII